jgi:hypothetical protein
MPSEKQIERGIDPQKLKVHHEEPRQPDPECTDFHEDPYENVPFELLMMFRNLQVMLTYLEDDLARARCGTMLGYKRGRRMLRRMRGFLKEMIDVSLMNEEQIRNKRDVVKKMGTEFKERAFQEIQGEEPEKL